MNQPQVTAAEELHHHAIGQAAQRLLVHGVEADTLESRAVFELHVDVDVEFEDASTHKCLGLYTVNQESLSRLPDEVVVELFRRGYLRLIHLMITSLKQFPILARKKNGRLLEATRTLAGAGEFTS